MIIDVSTADVVSVYQALVGVVAPRPIAWVTTVDEQGRVNLAPFSFFNAFGANPPVVVFSPTNRRDGSKKDTLLNLQAVPEFVLNAAVEDLATAMNATAKELPRGQSEAEFAGLELVPRRRSARRAWPHRRSTWSAACSSSSRSARAPSRPTW